MPVTIYLKAIGILFSLAIGLPLLIIPLHWARVMRWQIPADTHLTVYFGRCLGAVVVVISGMYIRYADQAMFHAFLLEMLLAAFTFMVLVHLWGFIRKTQPWTEHAEIPVYLGLAVYTAVLRFTP